MYLRLLPPCILLLVLTSCINPFAPERVYSDSEVGILGNQKTIDGFFQNFLYAYNMKDTLVYSNLLAEDFVFEYRNYDKGLDLSLSRQEDMITTYRMFNAVQRSDFIWNDISMQSGDELNRTIARSFNLTIAFSQTDIIDMYGKVYFILTRNNAEDNWRLKYWRDDSTY